jgi:hypothetical protein
MAALNVGFAKKNMGGSHDFILSEKTIRVIARAYAAL